MVSLDKIQAFCNETGLPGYRAKQLIQAVYKEGSSCYDDMTTLPKELRTRFAEKFPIYCFSVVREVASTDGATMKSLFKMADGALIEGVLMNFVDGRHSVCVSSQVGCGLKCAFCATGTMGFKRNLNAEEIADQVLYFDHLLKKKTGGRVDHVIFMGMGEPFLNFANVIESIRTMNDPTKLGIASRHITVSSSGVVPGIEKFQEVDMQLNLAISLHAPTQKLRESIMPIAKAYSLDILMAAIQSYIDRTHRRVSYEYVMLKNINDSPEIAHQLGKLIKGQMCHVNLIPYNQTFLGFSNAGKSRIDAFKEIVASYDIPTTVRVSLGQDINAACGQLAAEKDAE